MTKSRLLPTLLLAALGAALTLCTARADDAETSTIKFSDPAKPGTLKLTVTNGDLHIRGVDAAELTIRTELKPDKPAQRKDGLRVLTSSSSYSLTEKDNVVTLSYGAESWPTGGGDFDITVPRNTSIVIANGLGGDIVVGDVTGNIEIKSLNGEVKLENVTSSTLVETMNGEIYADIRAIADGKPLSFTSMNGQVQLTLNPAIKANVRLRTHNGSILTDFDDKQLVTKTAALKSAGRHGGAGSSDSEEIRATVREAVRAGVDAAREASRAAARGAREAMREARKMSDKNNGGDNDNDNDNDSEDVVEPVAPVIPVPPLPPMTGGKIVTGTLNGGGPELRVSTMNGDVTLRKADGESK